MDIEERSDHSAHSDDGGSESEDEVSGEHVISSTEECQPPYYEYIEENAYLFDRKKKINKEVRRMQCECTYDADDPDFVGCGEDCINRLLMIECNSRCSCGQFCTNKRFQQGCKVKVEVFKTEHKGWGLRTLEDLEQNQFVMEYCGEVLSYKDFQERAERYDKENRRHYYFMTLRADEIIDATFKGNLSRFINHSCDSNCETQKWTVNGLLRIGFFTQRRIPAGTELTFDYQLQRYGKIAQVCYCEAPNCRGFIGGEKQTPLKNTVERIATPSTSSPRRRRKKRAIANDFDDLTLEDEVEKLLGEQRGLTSSDQALKLSRLMVRAETTEQRVMLLKILQHTSDQSCLRGFLRYQGLSLLWSWMVDGGGKKAKLKKELMETLKYLPIATKNQLEDSKVIKVVRKWAASTSPLGEVGSSSGNSPADSECTAGTEDTDYDTQTLTKSLDKEKVKEHRPLFERQCSNKDQSDDDSLDAEVAEFTARKMVTVAAVKASMVAESSGKSSDDLSEDDGKSEDERSSENGDVGVALIANDLLKSWSSLKEVYKIPKKSATPAKQDRYELSTLSGSPAGSTDGEQQRSQIEQMKSPGKLDIIMKSLRGPDSSSPRPLFPRESGTALASKGLITCSAETTVKSFEDELPLTQAGDFSSLEFDDAVEGIAKETSNPQAEFGLSISSDSPLSQFQMQTFGYQQRMNFGAEQGLSFAQQKAARNNNKKKKKRTQNPFLQQQERNLQGDLNFGNANVQVQMGFGQQRGATQWRAPHPQPVQNALQNCQAIPYFPSLTGGRDQGPPPQNVGATNFSRSVAAPIPPVPNFSVPPPNIPPAEFFRKVPPPNFQQQNPSTVIPQTVPPPPLPTSQSVFFPRVQPPPFVRLPPPPQFPTSVSSAPPSHLLTGTVVRPPPSLPLRFPAQQNQFALFTPQPPPTNIPPDQQITQSSNQSAVQPLASASHVTSPSPAKGMSPQSRTVTSASSEGPETMDCTPSGSEPNTPSPVRNKLTHLPPHWKSATDPQGKVYYYHALTRKTQWELPRWESTTRPSPEKEPRPSETSDDQHRDVKSLGYSDIEEQTTPRSKGKKAAKTPSTPPGTPPESPTLAYTTAAADTTANRGGELPLEGSSHSSSNLHQKVREMFRLKLSNVVVNCLNPFFKVDCKCGRIMSTDDFKYLARKLTHGILMKELSHLKDEETLQCTDSVKIKTKEYIRSYMKKFGPVYKRT